MKYSFENIRFTKKRRRQKPVPVRLSPGQDHDSVQDDEAVHLVNALLRSPYPAKNDKISEFYSEVRQQSERNIGSASEWFDQITSNRK